jgi:hypothetical protein
MVICAFLEFIKKYNVDDCELIFVGLTDEITKTFINSQNSNFLVCYDIKPRDEVFNMFQEVDFFIQFQYKAKLKKVVAKKLYEYAIYNKPILSFNTREGEIYDFIKNNNLGEIVENDDVNMMIELFHRAYKGKIIIQKNAIELLDEYNYENSVQLLVKKINELK